MKEIKNGKGLERININEREGQLTVSSREVAENFEKRHCDVLENIRNLVTENSVAKYFTESEFENRGKMYPEYLLTRDGFTLLAMGFTGKKALVWKLKYIEAFNKMEEIIKMNSFNLPKTYKEALKCLLQSEEEREILQLKIEENKPLVEFAETCKTSKDNILVRQMAKIASKNGYKIGQQRLYRKLREWNLIQKNSTEPYQRAIENGYIEVKEIHKKENGEVKLNGVSKITPKGQVYIVNKLRKETA